MKPRENDPNHPYVRALKGCGHGRLFTEPCIDCEIVGFIEEYERAIRTVQRTRDRLRALGVKLPGNTSAAQQQAEPTIPMEVLRVTYAPDMTPEEFARMWPKFKAWQQHSTDQS